jgi:hypothetical protein
MARVRGAARAAPRRFSPGFVGPRSCRRDGSDRDQLHERHHFAPEGRDDHPSQRLDELDRHADALAHGARRSIPLDAAHVSRERVDVRLDRDRCLCCARVHAKGGCGNRIHTRRRRAHYAFVRRSDRAHRDRERAGIRAAPTAARREAVDRGSAAGGGHHRAPGVPARVARLRTFMGSRKRRRSSRSASRFRSTTGSPRRIER